MFKKLVNVSLGTLLIAVLTACGSGSAGNVAVEETAQVAQNDSNNSASFSKDKSLAVEIPAADSFEGGSGTEEDPYQIATMQQLKLLADMVNKKEKDYIAASYVLNNDIVINPIEDIDNWETNEPEYNWTVIGDGDSYNAFEGHFDGQGHVISGLYFCGSAEITGSSRQAVGLFGRIGENAKVENVILKDSKFYVSALYESSIGGIVGETATLSNAVIFNCENYADIFAENGQIGGVVGKAYTGATVDSCTNYGTVEALTGNGTIGGVAGSFCGYTLVNCVNNGTVKAVVGFDQGGVAGSLSPSAYLETNIKNLDGTEFKADYGDNIISDKCYAVNLSNAGKVVGPQTSATGGCGGVIGYVSNGGDTLNVSNLVNSGEVSGANEYLGGNIGYISISKWVNDESLTTISELQNRSALASAVKDSGDNNNIGGNIGYLLVSDGQKVVISDCVNDADLEGAAGGVINSVVVYGGGALDVTGCENNGNITAQKEGMLGGIISMLSCSKSVDGIPNNITIENCVNNGAIEGKAAAQGGIIGWAELMNIDGSSFDVSACTNSGDISLYYMSGMEDLNGAVFAAGIIGWLGTDVDGAYRVAGNSNEGDIYILADGVDNKEILENLKYFRVASIVGMECDNTELSGNSALGNIIIPSEKEINHALPEVGMEITDIAE